MKKMTIVILTALAMFFLTFGTAQAETSFMNFFKGIANGTTGAVYCILNTPQNIYDGAKENGVWGAVTGLGDFTRAAPKLVEEYAYALTLQETGRDITNPGIVNDFIEDYVFLHTVRNGAGTWFTVWGLVDINSSWTTASQAATWSAVPIAVGTTVNHLTRDER